MSLFLNASTGDLHLRATATSAIDHGVLLAPGLCDGDIDGAARPVGSAPDVGADEAGVPPRLSIFLPLLIRTG